MFNIEITTANSDVFIWQKLLTEKYITLYIFESIPYMLSKRQQVEPDKILSIRRFENTSSIDL